MRSTAGPRPRILAIMGSGETAPAMARVHRDLLSRLDPTAEATIVDTTYGFQENADDLSARMVETFRVALGRDFTIASYGSRDVDPVQAATALARIRAADYVLAGPGSPSYALRQWTGGPIPGALAEKLANGGIVTMASAAALTLGTVTVPVYEIYKVGADPEWLPGLNLMEAATGLRAAVVPHYDNAEGGNHDTRFCYLGERRLRILEAALPDGTFVLGIDGHTALILDIEAGSARVAGLGGVTVRVRGRSARFEQGFDGPIAGLAEAARELAAAGATDRGAGSPTTDGDGRATPPARSGTLAPAGGDGGPAAIDLEGEFVAAMADHDSRAAMTAILDLDLALEARLRSGEDSPELDDARARFRALLVRLAEAAAGSGDTGPNAFAPVIETILDLRSRARAAGDFPTADRIRDRLTDAGIEVRDGAEGSAWSISEPARR